jgi:hypothetical protein
MSFAYAVLSDIPSAAYRPSAPQATFQVFPSMFSHAAAPGLTLVTDADAWTP